jgi:hypothetical protein
VRLLAESAFAGTNFAFTGSQGWKLGRRGGGSDVAELVEIGIAGRGEHAFRVPGQGAGAAEHGVHFDL